MVKKIFLVLLSAVLLVPLILLPMTGCAPDPAKDIKALKESVTSLDEDVNSLASDMEQLQSDMGTLQRDMDGFEAGDTTDLWDALEELETTISDLDDALTSLQDDVAGLQGNGNGDSTTNGNEEYLSTRWSVDIEFDPALDSDDYDVDVNWYPTRIKDEDTYKFTVDIEAVGDGPWFEEEIDALWVSFNPTSRDTSVDINNTGIYSVRPIGIWWDSEYSPSDGVDCRSMVFVSDDFDIPVLKSVGDSYTIRFDFDLYYK